MPTVGLLRPRRHKAACGFDFMLAEVRKHFGDQYEPHGSMLEEEQPP